MVKLCLQLILSSEGNFLLMIGSLEVTLELIFTIPSVVQISSIWLRFNLGKSRIGAGIGVKQDSQELNA